MGNLPHIVCSVIPPHMLTRVAEHPRRSERERPRDARAHGDSPAVAPKLSSPARAPSEPGSPDERRRVYDARTLRLPGSLVRVEQASRLGRRGGRGLGRKRRHLRFFRTRLRRRSIDGKGMRLDATVHYGTRFENAMWNGRQMVYGDGDGRIFRRFTASLDVIAHELTHGVTQHSAALGYSRSDRRPQRAPLRRVRDHGQAIHAGPVRGRLGLAHRH